MFHAPQKKEKIIKHRRQVRSLVDHADPGLSLSELHVRTGFLGEGGGDGWSLELMHIGLHVW